ncbi:MAG TPA: hypothetical protein VFS47_05410 [Steroidobacteraceae bacterium]|nr:hypothetical protein [Steroidobacteraceae bacterium]
MTTDRVTHMQTTHEVAPPTQTQILKWFIAFTFIGALFDASVATMHVLPEQWTFFYVLPRAWLLRAVVVCAFRAHLSFWNSFVGRVDVGQQIVFLVVFPLLMLGVPVLRLLDAPLRSGGVIANLFLCLVSLAAMQVLLMNIGVRRFSMGFNYADDVLGRPIRGSNNRLAMLHVDLIYAAGLGLFIWACSKDF